MSGPRAIHPVRERGGNQKPQKLEKSTQKIRKNRVFWRISKIYSVEIASTL